MQKTGVDASFVYNENGLRVQKTVNGVVTDYTLHGKNIVHMTQGNNELHFFYDASSKPAIVVFNGTPYSYVKNLQGDIMAILNSAGTIVVNYVYDAWGNPISKTGTMAGTLGTVQPFRYRGYVYDEETGFYQLRNRYYSPNRNRFISSDNQLHKLMIPLSQNLYAYCFNRVISFADSNGNDAYWITDDQAAHQAGHTSLLLEDADGNWFYYYWGPDAGENPLGGDAYIKFDPITLTFDENGDLDLRALNETLIHNYGADAPAASHYDNALLFEGDFTKSIPVAQDLVQRESQHNGVEYRLFGDNCMQTSAAILSASLNAYDSFLLDLALIPTAPRLCRFYVWIFADDSIDLQKDE